MKVSHSSIELFCQCPSAYRRKAGGDYGVSFNESSRSGVVAHAIFADKFGGNEVSKLLPFPSMEEYDEAESLLDRVDSSAILNGGEVVSVEQLLSAFIGIYEVVAKADLTIRHVNGTLEIVDLKTGWKSSDPADDNQGVIAAYVAAKVYGVTEVKFTKYFVIFNDFRSQLYGPADFAKLETYIGLVAPLMEAALQEEEPHKNFGGHCVKCPYALTCNLSEAEKAAFEEMSPEKLEEKIDFYAAKKKAAEDTLKSIVKASETGMIRTHTSVHCLETSTVLKFDSRSEVSKNQFISKMLSSKTGREQIIGFLDVKLKDCAQIARMNGVKIREERRTLLKRLSPEEVGDETEAEAS